MICPVCNLSLEESSTPGVFVCPAKLTYIEELKLSIETQHVTLVLANNKEIYKVIEVQPYIFQILNSSFNQETIIFKNEVIYDHIGKTIIQNKILTLNHILDLPWNDKTSLFNKVNLLLALE